MVVVLKKIEQNTPDIVTTVVFKKTRKVDMDQIGEMCVCVCVCVENEDEMVGVEDDSELNHTIYRRINSVYFIPVLTTNSRMHNPIVLAFSGSVVGSAAVDCSKAMSALMKRH